MAAGKKLAANVYVGDTLYEAGSTPPKEVADQIDNPNAWESDDSDADTPVRDSGDVTLDSEDVAKSSRRKSADK